MPFSTVKSISRSRFSEARVLLELIESLEPVTPAEATSVQVKILRGLYYVHLYAALEKTVNESVEQTLLLISREGIANGHYKTPFNVISLHNKMQGFKDAGYKSFFKKSIDVFSAVDSEYASNINNTLFSTNLQNVWYKTLDEVLRCFGIPGFQIDPRYRIIIDDIVDKRNAVAHGRESTIEIGERHRSDVLRKRMQDIIIVSDLFIDCLETYIINKEYIKPAHRRAYVN